MFSLRCILDTPCADFKKFSEESIYNPKKKPPYGDSQDSRNYYEHGYSRSSDHTYTVHNDSGRSIITGVLQPRHPDDTKINYNDVESGARGYRDDNSSVPDNLATKIRQSLNRRSGQLQSLPDLVSPRSPLKHSNSFRSDTRDQLRVEVLTPPRMELGTVVNAYSSRPSSRAAATSRYRDDDTMMPRRNHGSSTRSASSRESTPVADGYNHPEYQNTRLFNEGRPRINHEGA